MSFNSSSSIPMRMKKTKPYQTIGYVLIACLSACSSPPAENSKIDSTLTEKASVISKLRQADSLDQLTAIPGNAASVSDVSTAAEISAATVYDEDDQAHQLSFDEGTMYCIMASWCPHSRDFLTIVNNKTYNPVTKSYKLVFLFDRNELPKLRKNIIENQEAYGIETEAQLQKLMNTIAERKRQGKLMFPEVLSEIPDDVAYYYFDTDFNYEMAGYPSSYTSSSGKFDLNPCLWYANRIPSQRELIKRMINFYTAEK